jgi:hypothetical protein
MLNIDMKIKEIIKESMTLEQAEGIFNRYGVKTPLKYSSEQLKKLYLALVKKNHPDIGGSANAMKDINAAYDILSKVKMGLTAFGFNKK